MTTEQKMLRSRLNNKATYTDLPQGTGPKTDLKMRPSFVSNYRLYHSSDLRAFFWGKKGQLWTDLGKIKPTGLNYREQPQVRF